MTYIKKIVFFYKNIHFQSLLSSGAMAIFGVLTSAILYRVLSITESGYYVFFITIIGLLDTIKTGFLTNAFIKFYCGAEINRSKEVLGSTWTLAIIITVVISLVNLISLTLSSLIHNYALLLFNQYFAIYTITSLPIMMGWLIAQAERKFDRLLWMRVANQVLLIGSILTWIYFKKITLITVINLTIITNSIISVLILTIGWAKVRNVIHTSKRTLLEIFHFGKYSVGTSLSSTLFKVTDTFIINFFLGPAALAMYNLGGRLIQIVEVPILSFVGSVGPALSSYFNNNMKFEMVELMKKTIGFLTLGILFLAFFSDVFAVPIISLLGGSKYTNSETPNLFRIFITIAILYPTDRFFALTLDVIHMPKVNFLKVLVMLLVNLLGDYLGVTLFHSVYAIVITNIFPVLTGIIISYFYLKKNIDFTFWSIYNSGAVEMRLFFSKFLKINS